MYLSIQIENLSAARSRIQNIDFAAEIAELTRNQILQQALHCNVGPSQLVTVRSLALLQS